MDNSARSLVNFHGVNIVFVIEVIFTFRVHKLGRYDFSYLPYFQRIWEITFLPLFCSCGVILANEITDAVLSTEVADDIFKIFTLPRKKEIKAPSDRFEFYDDEQLESLKDSVKNKNTEKADQETENIFVKYLKARGLSTESGDSVLSRFWYEIT